LKARKIRLIETPPEENPPPPKPALIHSVKSAGSAMPKRNNLTKPHTGKNL
jgi:hypothetical protein